MINTFDVLLIVAAFAILGLGLARRARLYRMGRDEAVELSPVALANVVLKHDTLIRRQGVGLAHFILFLGVVVPLLVVVATQFDVRLPEEVAAAFSLTLDLLGAGAFGSMLFLTLRRLARRDGDGPRMTLLPAVVLLGALVTGFLSEGVRLAILEAPFSWSTPVGYLVSAAVPASPLFMQLIIRLHFATAMGFVALVGFTFARHIVSGSVNVLTRRKTPPATLKPAHLEGDRPGAGCVVDFSWKQLLETDACVSCGRCEEHCPAFISGKPLSPRKVMSRIRECMERAGAGATPESPGTLLEETIRNEEIWACTTCMACVEHCPVYAEPLNKIIDMRRYRLMGRGALPLEARPMLRNLELFGDTFGYGMAHRSNWAFSRDIPPATQDTEVVLWVGCAGAFHPRYQGVVRAMARILDAAGVSYGILGDRELCCGDPARRLGEETLFLKLARRNVEVMESIGAGRVVALCPHCFNVLKNEYGALGARLQVAHSTEVLLELIRSDRIRLRVPVSTRLAFHDPCYLGRGNGLYEPMRELGKAVKGLKGLELPRSRESALCCGGGGGLMWLHEGVGRRINQVRAEEVVGSGAQMVGTACPYCLTMLEDGLKGLQSDHSVRVLDWVEIVADAVGVCEP